MLSQLSNKLKTLQLVSKKNDGRRPAPVILFKFDSFADVGAKQHGYALIIPLRIA